VGRSTVPGVSTGSSGAREDDRLVAVQASDVETDCVGILARLSLVERDEGVAFDVGGAQRFGELVPDVGREGQIVGGGRPDEQRVEVELVAPLVDDVVDAGQVADVRLVGARERPQPLDVDVAFLRDGRQEVRVEGVELVSVGHIPLWGPGRQKPTGRSTPVNYGASMHPRAEDFAGRAAELGVSVEVEEFPEGTKTAADAADAIGCSVAQIASSLAFSAGELVVVVTSGANRVDEAKLAGLRGVPASAVEMADPDEIRETLGWSIGGVPPFCHDTAVPVYLDETLLTFDTVWAAAGTPETVFPVDPGRIRELSDATPADVATE